MCDEREIQRPGDYRVLTDIRVRALGGGGGTGRTANSVGARARDTSIRRSVFLKNLLTYTYTPCEPEHPNRDVTTQPRCPVPHPRAHAAAVAGLRRASGVARGGGGGGGLGGRACRGLSCALRQFN
jgi:hypothetical protein